MGRIEEIGNCVQAGFVDEANSLELQRQSLEAVLALLFGSEFPIPIAEHHTSQLGLEQNLLLIVGVTCLFVKSYVTDPLATTLQLCL